MNEDEIKTVEGVPVESVVATEAAPQSDEKKPFDPRAKRGFAGGKGGRRPGGRGEKPKREKPEFDSKTLDVRRVTRVVSGGRRFSLHVSVIAGDHNGRVGLGTGKALDTQAAMEKAMKSAKRNMIRINLDDKKKIAHAVEAKYDTAKVWISPNNGKGLIAGAAARIIFSLAGVQNITAKFHGPTKNKLNNARAVMKALEKISKKA
jgi:small subunit ribosomal protein S5